MKYIEEYSRLFENKSYKDDFDFTETIWLRAHSTKNINDKKVNKELLKYKDILHKEAIQYVKENGGYLYRVVNVSDLNRERIDIEKIKKSGYRIDLLDSFTLNRSLIDDWINHGKKMQPGYTGYVLIKVPLNLVKKYLAISMPYTLKDIGYAEHLEELGVDEMEVLIRGPLIIPPKYINIINI